MTQTKWTNKFALITGASDGLGWELAQQIAARGTHVFLIARNRQNLEERVRFLVDQGAQATALAGDVTDLQQVAQILQKLQTLAPRLDLLINNVGLSTRRSLATAAPDDFRQQMEINFFAAVNVTQLAMPLLLRSSTHIVNIASLAAKSPWPYLGPYTASKSALATYTHQLRVELGHKLKVLLVCPGPIARDDAGTRYRQPGDHLPEQTHQPGGGAKLRGIPVDRLARSILNAIESGQAELVMPWRARLVFALAQLAPRWGDWVLRNFGGAKKIPLDQPLPPPIGPSVDAEPDS